MRYWLVCFLLGMLFLAGCADSDLPPEPGSFTVAVGKATDIYRDYSPPFDESGESIFFLSETKHELLLEEDFFGMTVAVDHPGAFIYKKGFVHTKAGWKEYEFPDETFRGSNWIRDQAKTTLNFSKDLFNDGENYIVAYACERVNNQWVCGLSRFDRSPQWMLERFYLDTIDLPEDPVIPDSPYAASGVVYPLYEFIKSGDTFEYSFNMDSKQDNLDDFPASFDLTVNITSESGKATVHQIPMTAWELGEEKTSHCYERGSKIDCYKSYFSDVQSIETDEILLVEPHIPAFEQGEVKFGINFFHIVPENFFDGIFIEENVGDFLFSDVSGRIIGDPSDFDDLQMSFEAFYIHDFNGKDSDGGYAEVEIFELNEEFEEEAYAPGYQDGSYYETIDGHHMIVSKDEWETNYFWISDGLGVVVEINNLYSFDSKGEGWTEIDGLDLVLAYLEKYSSTLDIPSIDPVEFFPEVKGYTISEYSVLENQFGEQITSLDALYSSSTNYIEAEIELTHDTYIGFVIDLWKNLLNAGEIDLSIENKNEILHSDNGGNVAWVSKDIFVALEVLEGEIDQEVLDAFLELYPSTLDFGEDPIICPQVICPDTCEFGCQISEVSGCPTAGCAAEVICPTITCSETCEHGCEVVNGCETGECADTPPPPPPPCPQKLSGCYNAEGEKQSSGTIRFPHEFGYYLGQNACVELGACQCSLSGFVDEVKQESHHDSPQSCSCMKDAVWNEESNFCDVPGVSDGTGGSSTSFNATQEIIDQFEFNDLGFSHLDLELNRGDEQHTIRWGMKPPEQELYEFMIRFELKACPSDCPSVEKLNEEWFNLDYNETIYQANPEELEVHSLILRIPENATQGHYDLRLRAYEPFQEDSIESLGYREIDLFVDN